MTERRAPSPRKRTLKAGTIVFNGGGGISGVVKNLSDSGALVHIESLIGIPDKFTLFIEADQFKRKCEIVWRLPNRIGVRFV
jgi:hypothetical protein